VEDLNSSNGTFVNQNEIVAPTLLSPGDELLIGTSVIQLRSANEVARQFSAVRAVPPALAAAPQRPTYADPVDGAPQAAAKPVGSEDHQLDPLRDERVKMQARLAPLAMLLLVVLIVLLYFGTK